MGKSQRPTPFAVRSTLRHIQRLRPTPLRGAGAPASVSAAFSNSPSACRLPPSRITSAFGRVPGSPGLSPPQERQNWVYSSSAGVGLCTDLRIPFRIPFSRKPSGRCSRVCNLLTDTGDLSSDGLERYRRSVRPSKKRKDEARGNEGIGAILSHATFDAARSNRPPMCLKPVCDGAASVGAEPAVL
jgi:hypothetical protein